MDPAVQEKEFSENCKTEKTVILFFEVFPASVARPWSSQNRMSVFLNLCFTQPLLCRALENRKILKEAGYLTRDSRVKESKKYGLVKARKAKQFSKR